MYFSGYIKSFSVILMFFVYTSHGQIAVTNNAPFDNAQGLVEDVLLGQGIVASNFTWQNGPQNIGYFDGVASNIGFDEGVIMCTGGIDFVTTGAGAGPAPSASVRHYTATACAARRGAAGAASHRGGSTASTC